jgi:hypothetical protein
MHFSRLGISLDRLISMSDVLHAVSVPEHPRLADLLLPYIPKALTILGFLEHASNPADLQIWTTFPITEAPPSIFGVFAYSDRQSRMFCSAEANPGAASAAEEAFVVSFTERCLRVAREAIRAEHAIGVLADSLSLMVGSVHEKWFECLEPLAFHSHRYQKYLLSSASAPAFASPANRVGLPEGASVGHLEDDDLDVVISTSSIPRRRQYLQERTLSSVCIRAPIQVNPTTLFGEVADASAPTAMEVQPVAWCLRHADGSFGTMFVVDEYKRRRLGTAVMQHLVASQDARPNASEQPTRGWYWVDVDPTNDAGMSFYGRMQGWEAAWVVSWMSFNLPS